MAEVLESSRGSPGIFAIAGDSLVAFDPLNPGITVYGPDGSLGRRLPVGPISPQLLQVIGQFRDGPFVARRIDSRTAARPGVHFRSKATLLLIDIESGQPLDSLVLPAMDMVAPPGPRAPTPPLRLHRNAVFAVSPRGVF